MIKRIYKSLLRSTCRFFRAPEKGSYDPHLRVTPALKDDFKSWGFFDPRHEAIPKVLISSGFGYGNVGDEAQLGACISRWKSVAPGGSVTLLSPNPPYTAPLHGERVEWASRVAWFRSNTKGPYSDGRRFEIHYRILRWRLEWSARAARANIPLSFTTPRESHILKLIQEHDILHVSGGGFLTGKTRSRLWDNCLLMRMCQLLGKPYFLTGHNIGVFQNTDDRRLAKMALSQAFWIGLRDRGLSEKELRDIGVEGPHILSTCDDALFCDRLGEKEVKQLIGAQGLDPDKPWVAVNFHRWGQAEDDQPKIEQRFAELCDGLRDRHNLQPVFIAMTPGDVEAERAVINRMSGAAAMIPYSPDYRVVRGIIADSSMVFTMKHHPIVFAQGECVPVVAVALDDYYLRKNIGAMKNTGHAEFVGTASDFHSDKIEQIIEGALNQSDKITQDLEKWTGEMRIIELDPYKKALDQIYGGNP